MLEGWRDLVQTLHDEEVFLQYTDILERIFVEVSAYLEESTMRKIIKLIELLTETVQHHTEPQTDCCFVTLLEIMASYGGEWEISSELESVWKGLGQTVDLGAPAENFRNAAYSMIMSLPWAPNTQDLHWICQIEDGESGSVESITPIPALQSVFDQISAAPLPRRDHLNRLVRRLKKNSPLTIAISSTTDDVGFQGDSHTRRGLGKTTLAAMLASHSTIQEKFCVLWLPMRDASWDFKEMTYDRYIMYLDGLCAQLSVKPEWPCPHYELEPPSLRLKRDEELLLQAKHKMAEILSSQGKDVLLVLDQVKDDLQVPWFLFSNKQSLVVTAEIRNLSADWTLELNVLSEEEALELFLTESGYPPTDVLSTSLEVKSTVQRCGFHPLIIRTVARWFRLKIVTAGVIKGLEELNQELSTCAAKLKHSPNADSSNPTRFLNEVMDLMLSPALADDGQPTKLMKLCLSSMAVVFSSAKVPIEVVNLLWRHLLDTEPDAIRELGNNLKRNQVKKRVRFISEALVSLGLISVTEDAEGLFLEIHHDMQAEYAFSLLNRMEFVGESFQEDVVKRWHRAFVEAYLIKRQKSDSDGLDNSCRAYAAKHLMSHMFQAEMWQDIVTILKDEQFVLDRLDLSGWLQGTKLHIADCCKLKSMMELNSSISEDHANVLLFNYLTLAAFLGERHKGTEEDVLEAARSLQCVGFALSENRHWSEATACYNVALKLIPTKCVLSSTILHSLGQACLINQDPQGCLKNAYENMQALDGLEQSPNEYDAYFGSVLLTIGDAMVINDDYLGAIDSYDKSLEKFNKDSVNSRVDIGKVLMRKGVLHQRMGELDSAMKVLQKCIKWKLKLGERSGELALAYSRLGDVYLEKDITSDAIRCFKQAARLMNEKVDEVEGVDLHLTAGKICEINGDYESCQVSINSALSCLKAATPDRINNVRTCYDICWITRTFMSHNDDDRALASLDECLEELQSYPDSLEVANILFYKGEYYLKTHGTNDALSFFKQALKLRTDKFGGNDCVIETLKRIGDIHKSNGELVEAEKHYQQALRQTEKLYGDENDKVASVLYEMGDLKKCMKEYSEALAVFSECLDVQKRTLGGAHPAVASTLHSMGTIYTAQHNYDMAYASYAEALDIWQENNHDRDNVLAETLHVLGFLARTKGDSEGALHFLLDALSIRKDLDNKLQTGETLAEIGHVHRLLDDPESAINCYKRCLKILIKEFGAEDESVGDVSLSLGHTMKRVNRYADAIEFYKRGKCVKYFISSQP